MCLAGQEKGHGAWGLLWLVYLLPGQSVGRLPGHMPSWLARVVIWCGLRLCPSPLVFHRCVSRWISGAWCHGRIIGFLRHADVTRNNSACKTQETRRTLPSRARRDCMPDRYCIPGMVSERVHSVPVHPRSPCDRSRHYDWSGVREGVTVHALGVHAVELVLDGFQQTYVRGSLGCAT